MIAHRRTALATGVLCAVAGVVAYAFFLVFVPDERLGLDLLFKLRGVRPPPAEVVIVAMDQKSAAALKLSRATNAWPRSVQTALLHRLAGIRAKAIVFDIFFREPDPHAAQDRALAAAMRRAGNVILFAALQRETLAAVGVASTEVSVDRLLTPTPLIAAAAVAVAPFILPRVPVQVSQFWTFIGAHGLATMPVAALQLYALSDYAALRTLLKRHTSGIVELLPAHASLDEGRLIALIHALRRIFLQHPELADDLLDALPQQGYDAPKQRRLRSLIAMYNSSSRPYVNFYGPPQTVRTLSYIDVLNGNPEALHALREKVVFVGISEGTQFDQRDNHYSVYSRPDGLDVSGVEIAATAFANLLHHNSIRPPAMPALLLLLVCYGLVVGVLCRLLPALPASFTALSLSFAYLGIGLYAFKTYAVWLPLVIPLFVQTPIALAAAFLSRYRETHRERERIRHAFGYYLPNKVVDQLTQDSWQIKMHAQESYGICLATDAEHYTRLAEHIEPKALSNFLNQYYSILFRPVRERGGIISDVIGDAMLAVWASAKLDAQLCAKAVEAALEINYAIKQFGSRNAHLALPTRIGLHAGQLAFSNVGAMDHYEYRPVGDTVNTAARIQALNKILGTQILASASIAVGLEGFVTRPLGVFRLAGKQTPLPVHEIMGLSEAVGAAGMELCAGFSAALSCYRTQAAAVALPEFARLADAFPDDGPTRFYLGLCHKPSAASIELWDGVVNLE